MPDETSAPIDTPTDTAAAEADAPARRRAGRRPPRSMSDRFAGLRALRALTPPDEAAAAHAALVDGVGAAWERSADAIVAARAAVEDARDLVELADAEFDRAAKRWGNSVRRADDGAVDAVGLREALGGVNISDWIGAPVDDELGRARALFVRLDTSPRGGADELRALQKATDALAGAWAAYGAAKVDRDRALAASAAAADAFDAAWSKVGRLWDVSGAPGFPRF